MTFPAMACNVEVHPGDLVTWVIPPVSPAAHGPVRVNSAGLYMGVVIRELAPAELAAAFPGGEVAAPAWYVHRPGSDSRLPAQAASTTGGYADVSIVPGTAVAAVYPALSATRQAIAGLLARTEETS